MNGSRSNTPGYGGKSSLDQLNRTIEGLEARIQGLVSERSSPVRASQSAASYSNSIHSGIHSGPANPVDEILERQRMLGARDRVSAAKERAPRHEPEVRHREEQRRPIEPVRQEPRQPAWSEPERMSQPPQQMAALNDIASTLAVLRAELKQGLGSDRLASEIGEIRNDMRSLKGATANTLSGDAVRGELARLGDSIDRLGSSKHMTGAEALHAELEGLRAMTAGLASDDSMRRLEDRWERAEIKLEALDPDALKQEVVQLAWRIDDMKAVLGDVSAAPAVRALEGKLIALAGSIESLGRNVEAQGDTSEHFAWLERRLDEISRAIAVSASQSNASTDSAAFQRLESRIGELTAHIDLLQAPSHAQESGIAERIEALTERVEDLANQDAAHALEERIGQLSKLIERNFRETAPAPEYSNHFADLSRKIDGLNTPTDAMMDRLELLSQRLDGFSLPMDTGQAPTDSAAMSRLESRLADIAARLDESVAAPAADNDAIRNLEQQVASLASLLSQPGNGNAHSEPDAFSGRVMAIEDYLASSDEFIVEAARQAAEAVVEAYSRSNISAGAGHSADISAIAGLAEDLRALEAHTRSSEERTAETFTALHQTLVQIARRLDDFGGQPMVMQAAAPAPVMEAARIMEPAQLQTVREPQPQAAASVPQMPRATQPEFADLGELMDAPVARPAPRNSKVDVLQDVELLLDSADADIVADATSDVVAPAAKAKPASKSLIAGLAAKILPAKKDKTAARVAIEPTPALDAAEMLVAAESDVNQIMEPGTGVPDVKKIMEKVRAGQKAAAASGKPATAGQADVIAAARRAAQAAAQEAGTQKFVQPPVKGKDKLASSPAKQSKSIFGASGEGRRPILLAAAAVLLVVMSYPVVSKMIGSRNAEEQPVAQTQATETQAIETQPAEQNTMSSTAKLPASQANIAAQPTAEQKIDATNVDTKNIDTGAKTLMAPANDAGDAKPLQKTEAMPPQQDLTVPADDMASTADDKSATDRSVKVDPVPGTISDPAAADPKAIPQAAAELPVGLQPAALVEAIKKGDPLAYFELAARYTDGRAGMKIDLAAAAKWYQLAVEKGSAPAEYRLASFYEKGTGVARDLNKAKALYLAAAEKGNASAMHNLAVLSATGAAGNPDFNAAAHWFEAAADLNIRDSQFNLAILYARGSGVKQDLTESYKWFGIAARQGDQDAAQKRDEVANAMSPDQLKTAKAKLDLWKPKTVDENANTPMVPDAWVTKSNTTASVDLKKAIRNIQAILNNNGFDAGKPDGEMGKKTVVAIKAFQTSVGQEPSGRIDDALVKELLKRNKKPA